MVPQGHGKFRLSPTCVQLSGSRTRSQDNDKCDFLISKDNTKLNFNTELVCNEREAEMQVACYSHICCNVSDGVYTPQGII